MIIKHLILAACFCTTTIAWSNQRDKSLKIKSVLEEYAANNLFNGSIIVANNDSILYKSSFGYANKEKNIRINSATLFPIASVSKQFTATAIMLLHERKLISIDDCISKYLIVPPYMESVKIKNLMNHTSGIPDYWQHNIESHSDSIDNFLNKQDSLLFEPNTNTLYSNSGYYLLGKIISTIADTSYSAFMQMNIFTPLKMNNTFVYYDSARSIAKGYDLEWNINEFFISTANGGIISCVDDLQKWNKALSNNTLIREETTEMMFKPAILKDGKITNKGYGWETGVLQLSLSDHLMKTYKNVVSHTGSISSYGAYNQFDSNNGQYIILLSNQIRPELIDLITEVNQTLY